MSFIAERAQALGFESISEYVEQRPRASLVALAAELRGISANEHAIDQLVGVLLERAKCDGRIERCARDLLVRALHQHLAGWPVHGDPVGREALGTCLLGWATSIGARVREHRRAALDIALELLEAPLPDGWLPTDADDTLLANVFAHHWVR